MAWNAELIVRYQSISEMMDAALETGSNKLTNGTIAIVEDDNYNHYIWNGIISKWKVRSGNMYNYTDLPSAATYNIDSGTELWDSQYKLKRRWTGVEWELQKDVENITLSGFGAPTTTIGKYGNCYIDLLTGARYIRDVLSKSKIDALSMYNAGTLTVTVSSPYTLTNTSRMFTNKSGLVNTGSSTYTRLYHTIDGADGYMTFDFNGSPQKINTFIIVYADDDNPSLAGGSWAASNDYVKWDDLGSVGSSISWRARSLTAEPFQEYRYYRYYFDMTSDNQSVHINDIFFYTGTGGSLWRVTSETVTTKLLFSNGPPTIGLGTENSVCLDQTTGILYIKNAISSGKVSIVSAVGNPNIARYYDNNLTTYNSTGMYSDVFYLGTAVQIDQIVFKRYAGYVLNMQSCCIFGSNDNVVWEHVYNTSSGDVYTDITVNLRNLTLNRTYSYWRFIHTHNSRLTEIEFYTSSTVNWQFLHDLKAIDASTYNNQLNATITSPQLLADYINNHHQVVSISSDTSLTSTHFQNESRFKVTNTDPVTLQLPVLTSAENNKAIEITKLGNGDVVATTTNSIGKLNNLALINNTGDIGESVTLEYSSEVSMFLVKKIFGSWIISATVPVYVTLTSVVVSGDGLSWVFTFSGNVIAGSDGFNVGLLIGTTWIGSHTLTYFSGSGTSIITYHSNRYIDSTDTISAGSSYTQPGKGISDQAYNSIKSVQITLVTNNSALLLPVIVTASIGTDGVTWSFAFDQNMTYTTLPNMFTVTMATAGVVTLTYSSGTGTPTIVFTGNKTISSTDTVTSGLNYNATNKSWYTPITLLPLKAFSNFLITNGSMQP